MNLEVFSHPLRSGLSQIAMRNFATLLYTSTMQGNSHPFINLKPEKGTPFAQSLSVKAIISYQKLTLKQCILANFKAFFLAVLTNFRYLEFQ